MEVTELGTDGKAAGLGAATVRGWELKRACGAPPLALRVELGGTSFAYSGDTEWTPALAQAAHGADLFAVEAYALDRQARYHLDYRTLQTISGRSAPGRSCSPICPLPCSPGSPTPTCPPPTTE